MLQSRNDEKYLDREKKESRSRLMNIWTFYKYVEETVTQTQKKKRRK